MPPLCSARTHAAFPHISHLDGDLVLCTPSGAGAVSRGCHDEPQLRTQHRNRPRSHPRRGKSQSLGGRPRNGGLRTYSSPATMITIGFFDEGLSFGGGLHWVFASVLLRHRNSDSNSLIVTGARVQGQSRRKGTLLGFGCELIRVMGFIHLTRECPPPGNCPRPCTRRVVLFGSCPPLMYPPSCPASIRQKIPREDISPCVLAELPSGNRFPGFSGSRVPSRACLLTHKSIGLYAASDCWLDLSPIFPPRPPSRAAKMSGCLRSLWSGRSAMSQRARSSTRHTLTQTKACTRDKPNSATTSLTADASGASASWRNRTR